ncbi:hypothetical protein TrLO_g14539 [Triparma laevis f. longispina]|uniref:Adenylate kinase n=1 Tax=Triparma laevis f. longispina TaxID=1714387 RepID=A0A9W7AQR3_9STRA|nr:hypothetical protein TrLO_g14539 [Triparma laevis f. longispina]
MSIFLLGPPGSGKGTYGKLLSKSLSLPLLTASTMLKSDSKFTEEYIKKGRLGPDDVVESTVRSYMYNEGWGSIKLTEKGWYTKNYILDGFPRTVGQYGLMKSWSPLINPPSICVHIDLPIKHCATKMKGRVECKYCNSVWNLSDVEDGVFRLPRIWPERLKCYCDKCTGMKVEEWKEEGEKYDYEWMLRRDDDSNPDIVAGRIQEYEEITEKILEEVEEERIVRFKPLEGLKSFGVLEEMVKERLEEIGEEDFF